MSTRVRPAVSQQSVREFAARDWARVADARAAYWTERKERLGFGEVLRVADQLRAQARAYDPTWPTEAQREEDLATHQRVAATLARVPVADVRRAARATGATRSQRRR